MPLIPASRLFPLPVETEHTLPLFPDLQVSFLPGDLHHLLPYSVFSRRNPTLYKAEYLSGSQNNRSRQARRQGPHPPERIYGPMMSPFR